MGLTVTRQTAVNLIVKKGNFFTVNHQTQVKINRKKVLRYFKSLYSRLSITVTKTRCKEDLTEEAPTKHSNLSLN